VGACNAGCFDIDVTVLKSLWYYQLYCICITSLSIKTGHYIIGDYFVKCKPIYTVTKRIKLSRKPFNRVVGFVVMFSVVSVHVCNAFNFWKSWTRKFSFWHAGSSSEYLGELCVSRSSGCQVLRSKKPVCMLFMGGLPSIKRQSCFIFTLN